MTQKELLKTEERAVFSLRSLYRRYGYCPYKMSRFEDYELYLQNKDFLASDRIITFSGSDGRLLALKPDVTLSIIKHSQDVPGQVQKLYYHENVFRADLSGCIREFMQTGVECVGDLTAYDVSEVMLLAARSLDALGGNFVLDVSHMGLVAAVLDSCGLNGEKRTAALQCLRQKNGHELAALCSDEKLQLMAALGGPAWQVLPRIKQTLSTDGEMTAFAELERLCAVLERNGYGSRVWIDFSVGNDMKYYSGVVFKGYLEGIPTGVLSGGQYDKLLRKMGRSSRAIGFAVNLSLLEQEGDSACDVDTLILHGADTNPVELAAAASRWAEEGSVLVAPQLPQGRAWKRLIRL